MRFMSAGLTLYLIEPRASDLIFYVENDPHVALTVGEPTAEPQGRERESVQLFGNAQVLAPHELRGMPDDVQRAYGLKNRQVPGVYVVIEVKPRQVYRVTHRKGVTHRHTIDVDSPDHGEHAR